MREAPGESRSQPSAKAGSEWQAQQQVIGSVENLLEPKDPQPQEGEDGRWWTPIQGSKDSSRAMQEPPPPPTTDSKKMGMGGKTPGRAGSAS